MRAPRRAAEAIKGGGAGWEGTAGGGAVAQDGGG